MAIKMSESDARKWKSALMTKKILSDKRERKIWKKQVLEPECRLTLKLPVEVFSSQNLKNHWAVQLRLKNNQREALAQWTATYGVREYLKACGRGKCTITLVRLGCKAKMDSDSLAYAFKSVRDYIAELMGLGGGQGDQDSEALVWKYSQDPQGKPGILIHIDRLL